MTDPVHEIPLDRIDAEALPRDRATCDPEADHELQLSILAEGLRQPVEVFAMEGPVPYGLIAGHRRLSAFRALGREVIPAFLRRPADIPQALAAMVSENEIRAQISPWEKGRLVMTCVEQGHFPNADAAIDGLYATLSRQKRSRLRSLLLVVETFDGRFATPERLTHARLERLASALRAGWEDMVRAALPSPRTHGLESQWQAIAPVLAEAASPDGADTAPDQIRAPRRILRLRQGLTIRREVTRSGWALRFSGPEAKSPGLMDDVMDMVERMFSGDAQKR